MAPFKRDAEKKNNDDKDRRGMLDFCSPINVFTPFVRLQIFATSTMRSSSSSSYAPSLNAGCQDTPKKIGFAVVIPKCSTSRRSIGISWRLSSLPLVAKGSGHARAFLFCQAMIEVHGVHGVGNSRIFWATQRSIVRIYAFAWDFQQHLTAHGI